MVKMKLIEKQLAGKAVDFRSLDADGNEITLSGFHNKANVFLVFNRGFT